MLLTDQRMREKHEELSHFVTELDQFAELPHSKALSVLQDFVIESEIKRLFETATEKDAWGRINFIKGMLSMHIDKILLRVEGILKKEKK